MELFTILLTIGLFVVGLYLLIKGSDVFIDGAAGIALKLGASEHLIGVTLVALATSLPELAASCTAAIQNLADLALGNVVGSNIWNSALVLGIAPLVGKTLVRPSILVLGLPFMWLGTIMLLVIIRDRTVKRREGAMLLLFYIIFITVIFFVRTVLPGTL